MILSIIYFPIKKTKEVGRKRKIISQSNEKAYVNHQFIRDIMKENGYKRQNDVFIQALEKITLDT